MRIRQVLAAALLSAAVFAAPSSQGAAITGTIGFGDGLETTMGLPGAVVVGLTTIDPFTPSIVAPCTGGFTGCSGAGSAFTFNFGPLDQIIFTADTFTFHVTLVPVAFPPSSITPLGCVPTGAGATQLCTDKFNFNGTGYVHDSSATFEDTLILIGWALTGNCLDTNGDNLCDSDWGGTYSATITATGVVRQVPEPATLTLLGVALAGLGFAGIRRRG